MHTIQANKLSMHLTHGHSESHKGIAQWTHIQSMAYSPQTQYQMTFPINAYKQWHITKRDISGEIGNYAWKIMSLPLFYDSTD